MTSRAAADAVEIVVVGGGMLGAAVAYALCERGLRDVVVLEAEDRPGRHSTARSVAYFIPMYESSAFALLAKASIAFLREPPGAFAARPILDERGALVASTEAGVQALEHEIDEARALGVPIIEVERAEIRDRVPIVRADLLAKAAFYPTAGEIDVDALFRGFIDGARREGARFMTHCRFVGARISRGAVTHAMTSRGPIACRHIVNAAGAWAGEVGRASHAMAIAFDALRRHIVSIDLPAEHAAAQWPFFRCPSIPLFCKPAQGRLLASPMDAQPDAPGDCQVRPAMVAATLAAVTRYTTLQADRAASSFAGHRSFARSKLPVVGPDTTIEGFHWAAGLGGAGIMAAPAVGRIVADGVLGRARDSAWDEIAPARSLGALR